MLKLIDYIRLRQAGFNIVMSWRISRRFTALDKLALTLWCLFIIYAMMAFVYAVNSTLIHNNASDLLSTRLTLHSLQSDNAKLEKGVIALLNGQPVKLVDAYYVFSKKVDNTIE